MNALRLVSTAPVEEPAFDNASAVSPMLASLQKAIASGSLDAETTRRYLFQKMKGGWNEDSGRIHANHPFTDEPIGVPESLFLRKEVLVRTGALQVGEYGRYQILFDLVQAFNAYYPPPPTDT